MTRPTLAELPPDAHLAVVCPFCQIRGALSPNTTANATALTWKTPTRARFHAIPCPTCGRAFDVEADHAPASA